MTHNPPRSGLEPLPRFPTPKPPPATILGPTPAPARAAATPPAPGRAGSTGTFLGQDPALARAAATPPAPALAVGHPSAPGRVGGSTVTFLGQDPAPGRAAAATAEDAGCLQLSLQARPLRAAADEDRDPGPSAPLRPLRVALRPLSDRPYNPADRGSRSPELPFQSDPLTVVPAPLTLRPLLELSRSSARRVQLGLHVRAATADRQPHLRPPPDKASAGPRRPWVWRVFGALIGLGVALFATSAASAAAPEDSAALAERLIQLRGQVEALHDDIQTQQRQHRGRMSSLSQRRAELEGQLQRQELELKRTQKQLGELKRQTAASHQAAAALRPAAEAAIQTLRAAIDAGLPFSLDQRRAELEALQAKLQAGELSPPRVIQQLWSFTEDELRLCRESGLFRQTIQLDGQEQLADVIRLGMSMLFFRTGEGVHGFAQREGQLWRYQPVDGAQLEAARQLFDAFERNLRTGYFLLPNPLSAPAGGQR